MEIKKPRKHTGTLMICAARNRGICTIPTSASWHGENRICFFSIEISVAEYKKIPLTLCRLNDL